MTERPRIIDALTPLVAQLLALDFESRVEVAHRLGLLLATCPGCMCYLGAPTCLHGKDGYAFFCNHTDAIPLEDIPND